MRQAHDLAAMIIHQAQRSTEGWSEDQAEHDALDAALSELAHRHERAAGDAGTVARWQVSSNTGSQPSSGGEG